MASKAIKNLSATKFMRFQFRDLAIACSLIAIGVSSMTPASAQRKKAPSEASAMIASPPAEAKSSPAMLAKNSAPEDDPKRFVSSKNPEAKDLLSLFGDAAISDPTYNAAKGAYIAGKENFWQGLSYLMPQVAGNYSANNNSIRYVNRQSTQQDKTFDISQWTVQLTQPVFNWAAFEKFRSFNALDGIAEVTFAQAQQDLVIRVSQAYFDVLAAQDNLDLYRNKKRLIKEQYEQAKRNFEIGTATIVDSIESQSRYDLAAAQELQAQTDLANKITALEVIVGQKLLGIRPVAQDAKIGMVVDSRKVKYRKGDKGVVANQEQINELNLPTGQTMEDWIRQAEEVNYNVLAGKLGVDSAKANLNAARAGHLPSVNFVGSVQNLNQTGSLLQQYPANYFNNQYGLQVTVPIFSGGYTQSVVRQSAGLLQQAEANFELAKRTSAQQAKQAFLGFNTGLAQVKAYETAEQSALQSLKSNSLGYDVGVRINIDVLNAQDQLFTTRTGLYKSRYDAIMNGLKLKSAAAILSDEDLRAVNALLR